MQRSGEPILLFLALFCRVLAVFPLWLAVLSICGTENMWLPTGILLGCTLLSNLGCRFFRLHFRMKPRRAFLCSTAVILPAAALCGLAILMLTRSLAAAIVLTFMSFLLTHLRLTAEPEELFRTGAYAAFLTGVIIVCALLGIAHWVIPMQLVLCAVGVLSAVYLLLCNQFMLLRLVNRRSVGEANIPQDIRRGNLLLVGGVIFTLVLLFLFREPLLHLLGWMMNTARILLKTLLSAIVRLLDRLGGDAPEPALSEAVEEAPELLPPEESHNPLWLLTWIPVAWVAWHIWREFLSDWVFDLRILIGQFIRRLRGLPAENNTLRQSGNAEYTDIETDVRPHGARRRKMKSWKRALKAWQTMPENDAKFYAGYRLLLDAPCWEKGELRAADTVRQIQEKWMQGHTPPALLDAVTTDFHTDRYAEQGLPPEALADIKAALTGILHIR